MFRNFYIAICFSLISPAFAGKPFVRGISFTASDREATTQNKMENALIKAQIFFRNEMQRHKHGSMEFTIGRDINNSIVREIQGAKPLTAYPKIESLADEIDDVLGDFSKDGEVRVVFISGIDEISEKALATHRDGCSLEHGRFPCEDYVFIPADSEVDLALLIVHELGHAFGLGHHPSIFFEVLPFIQTKN